MVKPRARGIALVLLLTPTLAVSKEGSVEDVQTAYDDHRLQFRTTDDRYAFRI